jgi:hypothetical protein
VSDDQKVVLLALKFQDDRLEADGKIVVGLILLAGYERT